MNDGLPITHKEFTHRKDPQRNAWFQTCHLFSKSIIRQVPSKPPRRVDTLSTGWVFCSGQGKVCLISLECGCETGWATEATFKNVNLSYGLKSNKCFFYVNYLNEYIGVLEEDWGPLSGVERGCGNCWKPLPQMSDCWMHRKWQGWWPGTGTAHSRGKQKAKLMLRMSETHRAVHVQNQLAVRTVMSSRWGVGHIWPSHEDSQRLGAKGILIPADCMWFNEILETYNNIRRHSLNTTESAITESKKQKSVGWGETRTQQPGVCMCVQTVVQEDRKAACDPCCGMRVGEGVPGTRV